MTSGFLTPVLGAGAIQAADLLRFWVALAVLLLVARGLGLLAKRLGQPSVIGELTAGVVLGPTLLGRIAPDATAWLFQGEVASLMLATISWLGVVMLLAITGFETDLGLLRRLGKAASWTSATSLVIPFVLGIGVALALPDSFRAEGSSTAFVLFMGVALAISALPVVATVLREMGVIGRPVGQVTLAAGMVNDLVGWVLLGVVAGLARTGSIDASSLLLTIAGIAAFLAAALTMGQRVVDRLLRSTAEADSAHSTRVGMALGIVLVFGAITQALGVEAVLGAFVAGILLARSPLGGPRIEHHVSAVTDGFLAPIFFATAGLQVDLLAVVSPEVLPWAVALIAVATVGKVLGGWVGGRLGSLSHVESLAVGVGLNARGALEIVVASIGLGLGVLTGVAYSVVVVMAVLTSMMAPPALTLLGRRLAEAGADTDTLQQIRDAQQRSRILRARTALLPTRGGASSVTAGTLLDQLLPAGTQITALTVHPPELRPDQGRAAARELGRTVGRRLAWRDRTASSAADAILEEARLGYDVIAVGASADDPGTVVSPALAQMLAGATVPVVVVQAPAQHAPTAAPATVRGIVAALDGTPACDAARDVAASLAVAGDADLHLVHVVDTSIGASDPQIDRDRLRRAVDRAEIVGRAARARAASLGAAATLNVQTGSDVADTVLDAARDVDADTIVIGVQIRSAEGDAVLGRTVERLLTDSERTVVVVALPAGGGATA